MASRKRSPKGSKVRRRPVRSSYLTSKANSKAPRELKLFQVLDIPLQPFGWGVRVLIGPLEHLTTVGAWLLDWPDIAHGFVEPAGLTLLHTDYNPIIWLPRKPRGAKELGALAHEAAHATRFIFVGQLGIPITAGNDEIYCHCIGWIVRRVLEQAK